LELVLGARREGKFQAADAPQDEGGPIGFHFQVQVYFGILTECLLQAYLSEQSQGQQARWNEDGAEALAKLHAAGNRMQ
jgi:hypothetical protein